MKRKRTRKLRPILADPEAYGQAGPPEHFEPLTFAQFGERLELCACIQLGNVDEDLPDALGIAEYEGGGGMLVSTCYHEAGHAVAAAAGFCDSWPSEVFARGAPDAEKRLGLVAAKGRPVAFFEPWQLTSEAVQTMAAAVVEAKLAGSATVHPYGGDAEILATLEAYGCAPLATVERMAWALVLAEWERIERLAVALIRAALETHREGETLEGRLSWGRVLEVLEIHARTGRG